MNKHAVTWLNAAPVLSALATNVNAREIFVFGSVAREGRGNDLDVVVTVDSETYIVYLTTVWRSLHDSIDDFYANFCDQRVYAALKALKLSPAEYGWFELARRGMGAPIDIHLMPENWLGNIDGVQKHLPHADSEFVKKIAGDARGGLFTTGLGGEKVWVTPLAKASAAALVKR